MSSRTYSEPKKKNSAVFSPTFGKKSSDKSFTTRTDRSGREMANSHFGHNFGDVRVKSSQSFKQSCPLSLSGPTYCPFGGACHTCPVHVQTKLKIGKPRDKYEQEADRVAEQVTRIPKSKANPKAADSGREHRSRGNLQRSALHQTEPSSVPSIVQKVLSLPGQPLDLDTRAFMESRFGADFSVVRVHTDTLAARSAKAVGAWAYTVGSHIVFDEGLYAPNTAVSRCLLAHELVHILQQCPQTALLDLPFTAKGNELQRAAHPALLAALAILVAIMACGLPFHLYALTMHNRKSDKWRHCWVSCEMSKTCGAVLAELTGLGKEIRDRAVAAFCDYYPNNFVCTGGHSDFLDSLGDLVANQYCIPWETFFVGPLARLWRQSCSDCCDASGL